LPSKTSAGSDTLKPLMPIKLAAYLNSYEELPESDNSHYGSSALFGAEEQKKYVAILIDEVLLVLALLH